MVGNHMFLESARCLEMVTPTSRRRVVMTVVKGEAAVVFTAGLLGSISSRFVLYCKPKRMLVTFGYFKGVLLWAGQLECPVYRLVAFHF